MGTLIDAAEFRARFQISEKIEDARFALHIYAASLRLRKWVSHTVYQQVLATVATDDEDLTLDELQKRHDFRNAEANLTYHYAVYSMNYPLGAQGILKIARAEGDATHQYLSPTETEAVSLQFLNLAREIMEAYMADDGTPDSPFETFNECL